MAIMVDPFENEKNSSKDLNAINRPEYVKKVQDVAQGKLDVEYATSKYIPQLNETIVGTIIDTFVELVYDSICIGKTVKVRSLGKFYRKIQAPKQCRNKHTGEPINVGPKYIPAFMPYRTFKADVADRPVNRDEFLAAAAEGEWKRVDTVS